MSRRILRDDAHQTRWPRLAARMDGADRKECVNEVREDVVTAKGKVTS